MNKTEALKRLDALETEAAALRRIIEAPEPVEKKPLLTHSFTADMVYPGNPHVGSNVSDAYAEAFNTILDLRRQPGSEVAEDGKHQWYINSNGVVAYTADLEWKLQQLCTMFDSEASALAARKAVGFVRILRMYNTLHGRGYE